MFGDMMGKLNEMKQQMDDIKKRLDTMEVDAEAGDGAVKVVMSASRQLKNININEDLLKEGDKEEVEDLVAVAVNRALDKAKEVEETEMQGAAGGLLPPGMLG